MDKRRKEKENFMGLCSDTVFKALYKNSDS